MANCQRTITPVPKQTHPVLYAHPRGFSFTLTQLEQAVQYASMFGRKTTVKQIVALCGLQADAR